MTVVIPPLKGHFSEFLVSNIFCYPRFPNLSFASLTRMPTTHINQFSQENSFCLSCSVQLQKTKVSSAWILVSTIPNVGFFHQLLRILRIYIKRNTAVFLDFSSLSLIHTHYRFGWLSSIHAFGLISMAHGSVPSFSLICWLLFLLEIQLPIGLYLPFYAYSISHLFPFCNWQIV
jgi:hypothetical protein